MKAERPWKIVIVLWEDAAVMESRWTDLDELEEDLQQDSAFCVTLGFLVEDNEERITVCMTDGSDQVGPYCTIPKSCVKKMEILRNGNQEDNSA